MNIHFFTLGCKVNQYETEAMREEFFKRRHFSMKFLDPDAVVINSCSVTAESDRKTRQLVNKIRKNYPDVIITLTGCSVQAFPEKAKDLPVDVIIGNTDVKATVDATINALNTREKFFSVLKHPTGEAYNTLPITGFDKRTRAFMKIEDGCDRYCSYCIIPFARGHVRSRNLDDIKKEAAALAQKGYKEIVLVGINLSAYGKDSNIDICDAVNAVCETEGILRVRLGSLEPDHITDDMLERLKAQPKFCPQFHLSLQSGCDETLKRMNRHYDTKFYLDLVTRIRKTFDSPAITTDIMVGFAGETEEEFEQSLNFAKKVKFSRAHIFCYSQREGTVAAKLENQVTNSEKQRRSQLMCDVTSKTEKKFLYSHIGKIYSVLPETEGGGYLDDYCYVLIKKGYYNVGEIITVKIVDVYENKLIGEISV